ncbi:ATP-binding protein [Reinekea marina]|uniref:histidine kinase n=2 Tax=Reinekea marina TaxID=1310421 RepID=A0ABV7WUQ1_9GAMM
MNRVAIVDDQKSSRLIIQKVVSETYDSELFSSGEELFNAYQAGTRWDMVLSDLHMKDTTGRDVVEYFKAKNIPVMILTADSERSVESELLSCGATDFVTKPIHPEILLNRIAIQLRLREQTEQINATQDQLIQSEKLAALGQLAAGVAHEINNPIGFVSSNMNLIGRYVGKINEELEALKEHCEQDPTGAGTLLYATWSAKTKIPMYMESLEEITGESKDGLVRVRDIVKDLKEYSHIGEVKFEHSDINHLLESSVNLLRNEIKYKAEVEFDLANDATVECIASQLGQVFVNIIVNACHAIEEFGRIGVKTTADADNIVVSISDNGKGMSEEVKRKIFDPFFTTKGIGKGTGIGLAITQSIIERHNGNVEVDSVEGEGTTFIISLPKEQPEQTEEELSSAQE